MEQSIRIPSWKKQGFSSRGEYEISLVHRRGFKSSEEYRSYLAHQRGFSSHNEYRSYLAHRKDFKSPGEYRDHLVQKRWEAAAQFEFGDDILSYDLWREVHARLSTLLRGYSEQDTSIPIDDTLAIIGGCDSYEDVPRTLELFTRGAYQEFRQHQGDCRDDCLRDPKF